VWNRQRTDTGLADPGNVTLGHKSVPRWNPPGGWVISNRPAHPALVSEDDLVAAQDISAARGPVPQDGPVLRRYLLAGALACGVCGRRMESAWSNGKAAYRCRHGRTSAMAGLGGPPTIHLPAGQHRC
jgi:site-specific DNA recombinase